MIEADEHLEDTGEIPAVVDGTTILADVLRERAPLPEPELLKTFLDVVCDLERIHGDGMLHRDINPETIVLNGEGWKLVGYGLARVGTVRYMSPERCEGKPIDARSDIYSLGVVLFQAATGKLPFDAEMKFEIMEAHANNPPPLPNTINPAISFELEQVILRALAKDPSSRFQTAEELRLALEAMVPASERRPEPLASQTAEAVAEATIVAAGAETMAETASGGRRPFAMAETAVEPVQSTPEGDLGPTPRRLKSAAVLVPLGAAIAVVAGLLLFGVIGARRVPAVTCMSTATAEQMLRGGGFRAETDSVNDTLPAGTVLAQVPAAGAKGPRSRVVELRVSTGEVEMPVLAGLALPDARARLAELALTPAKVDSQYTDDYASGIVVSSKLKAGTKVVPHSSVGLTVSAGRVTCPQCGARRAAGAKFCTTCGFRF
jgi:eukaryotic-like serine/threonine-protein kinase